MTKNVNFLGEEKCTPPDNILAAPVSENYSSVITINRTVLFTKISILCQWKSTFKQPYKLDTLL